MALLTGHSAEKPEEVRQKQTEEEEESITRKCKKSNGYLQRKEEKPSEQDSKKGTAKGEEK